MLFKKEALALASVVLLLLSAVIVAQLTLSTPSGSPSGGFSDGVGSAAHLSGPVEMKGYGHADGSMYISDRGNHAIRKLNPTTNYLSTVVSNVGNPSGISGADPNGNVYFCNEGSTPYHLMKLTSGGALSTVGTYSWRAYGVWYNKADGFVYTTAIDVCQIHKVNPDTGADSIYAGSPSGSCSTFNGNGVYRTSATYLNTLASGGTSNGDYYFTLYHSYAAMKIVYSSGMSYTVAGIVGSSGHSDGPVSSALFRDSYGIDATDDGYVYISDAYGNYARKVFNGQVSTIAGTGGASTTDGPALTSSIYWPWGLSAHIAGKLYLVSYAGNSIRLISGLSHQGDQGFTTYCCSQVFDDCANIHTECNALTGPTSSMAAVCSTEPAYCDVYNYGVTLSGICSQMAANCDSLISSC